jgi:hypothetical protein
MIKPKIINRDPPGWQAKKLELAQKIVDELKMINNKLEVLVDEALDKKE